MKYELNLTPEEKKIFIGMVKHQMRLKQWRVKDLADAIGYKPSSVYQFLSNPKVKNRFLAAEIADKLHIEDWGCMSAEGND